MGRGVQISLNFVWDQITVWLKELLVSSIMGNVTGLFDNVNTQVGNIASEVGSTPQAWNSGVFNMIKNLSDNVILPIAGMILTIVATLELIQMVVDRNNMHDVDTFLFFKWIFKTACAVLIVSNTWNITMGVFDVAQHVVGQAAGIIVGDTSIQMDAVIADLETRIEGMELGAIFSLWLQSELIGFTMWAMTICIFIIVYGRMVEIYLVTSIAPIPMATMASKEWGQMGQNYIRSLFALGFQAFLIIICVAIYAVLVQNIALEGEVTYCDVHRWHLPTAYVRRMCRWQQPAACRWHPEGRRKGALFQSSRIHRF